MPASSVAQRNGAFAFALLVSAAAVVVLAVGGPPEILLIWGPVVVLSLAGGFWGRRVVKRQRLVEDALAAPTEGPGVIPVRAASNIPPPPLSVEVLKARKLPKPAAKYRRVTAGSNVIGRPPLKILHLWVFENYVRLSNYLQGGWREFGHVHLLRQAGSVTAAQFAEAQKVGQLSGLFAEDRDEVHEAMASFDYQPSSKKFKRLKGFGPASTSTFDRYGSYPVNSLLSHSDVWRYALRVLLEHVDVVTIDLSGYTPENIGTLYEIGELIDTFPIRRIIWLTDPWSDVDFLERQLREAWSGVAVGSPNRTEDNPRARLVITDRVDRTTKESSSGTKSTEIKLVSVRMDARRIFTNLLTE